MDIRRGKAMSAESEAGQGRRGRRRTKMDSILVVCYSYTGTSRRAAQLLCSHHGWPLGEILDAAPRGTLRCVLDVLLRRHPPIRYQGPDPGDFRTVVLVAPVWMYRLAAPMRTFLAEHRSRLPRVAAIVTMNAGGATNALADISHVLGHAPIACASFLQRQLVDGSATGKLLEFGDVLQPGAAPEQPPAASGWTRTAPGC